MQVGKSLVFEITANRFLYGMVRALVGTMVNVGRRHTRIDDFEKILEAKDRGRAGMSAPAKGLFLEEILY
jgi:tRNA pseudouridine38-40 synthase